jgi:hypothetical protein
MVSRLKQLLLVISILHGWLSPVWLSAFQTQPTSVNLTGNWIGSFDITNPDGRMQHDTAFLQLAQNGITVTGSAGGNEHQLSPITEGRFAGQELHFAISFHGAPLNFDLRLQEDHLRGAVTGAIAEGGRSIAVDVVRERSEAERGRGVDRDLYDEISRQDSALFQAFNQRYLKSFESFFSKDMEFYHDKEGLSGYDKNMESFQRHFAEDARIRRELVEGTLEVYPLAGFGAVELGIQRFYTTEKDQPERLTATSRFVTVWEHKNSSWKITREISYDHR